MNAISVDEDRQGAFARLSGDINPMHTDALYARRTQIGNPVAHGIHLVLLALQTLRLPSRFGITSLDAQFRKPLAVGDDASVASQIDGDSAHVTITSRGLTCATVDVVLTPGDWSETGGDHAPAAIEMARRTIVDAAGAAGIEPLAHSRLQFRALFPHLADVLSPVDASLLLAATRIVGMRCPGEQALFRRLTWASDDRSDRGPGDAVQFEVASVDSRFDLIRVAMRQGQRLLTAEVVVRPSPPSQPSTEAVGRLVQPDEFSAVRALVVGGSRGLGEIAAKAVIAGGGTAMVTYRSGREESLVLAQALGPRCVAVSLDVDELDQRSLRPVIAFSPTHLLYFATPKIVRKSSVTWDVETFEQFVKVYVTDLARLLCELTAAGSLRSIFYPSTVFLDDHPRGFSEYIAAKAAGEAMLAAWGRMHPTQQVSCPRLPSLVTDQTFGRAAASTADNLLTMIPVLRNTLRSAASSTATVG